MSFHQTVKAHRHLDALPNTTENHRSKQAHLQDSPGSYGSNWTPNFSMASKKTPRMTSRSCFTLPQPSKENNIRQQVAANTLVLAALEPK